MSEKIIEQEELLEVYGARAHNLKNININIPRNKLVTITGLSGSGKSSLAFDTIYAEGQRRYVETFSAYARQFLGNMERPDVDKINGLSPVISIEQKTTSKSPRSTVGTITEVYDFLRLLYARVGDAYSSATGKRMVSYSEEQIIALIVKQYVGKKVQFLAPKVKSRKGHYRELFEKILRQGFVRARVDGEIVELTKGMKLDRYKTHDIEIVIDRLLVDTADKRLMESMRTALEFGDGVMMIHDYETDEVRYFSSHLMCEDTGISYPDPEPNAFSFNSPKGACKACNGIGTQNEIDLGKVIPDGKLSIKRGGIAPLGEYKKNWIFGQLDAIAQKFGFLLTTPLSEVPKEGLDVILNGATDSFQVKNDVLGIYQTYNINFEGLIVFMQDQYTDNASPSIKRWVMEYMNKVPCGVCKGSRLQENAGYFKIGGKTISELTGMDIEDLICFIEDLKGSLDKRQAIVGTEILKEISTRLGFLKEIGLGYLTLSRNSGSLSGGEAQRIRLATQIGSQLVGVLYILDEPSIGLHQSDNSRLIQSLLDLRDIGNSVIVVEHDKEMIERSDHVIDIGPGAGVHGGEIVAQGTPAEILSLNTTTAQYMNGEMFIEVPTTRREGTGEEIIMKGATGNNLKGMDVSIPLGKFVCVTGVSGSGKSSLINGTLYPILNHHFFNATKRPMPYESINGLRYIDKVIDVDQSPIGRTPRSNPATYTGVFSEIRTLFSNLPESKVRNYKPGRFSFNVKGGRCETCQGAGVRVIEMNFLPDVHVPCHECSGKRFNRETLEIRYKGKSISDILNMTINQAVEFFEHIPKILKKIQTLKEVGLGYITLGQQSTTLSGGEAQRVKLATELSKRDTGKTFYILDEPTTGLHFEDIRVLLGVLNKLVERGNSVLVIEHNLDVIKVADHIIDLGPEGGSRGGEILFQGSPEDLVNEPKSKTAPYLKIELELAKA
jgi:excinuclease ABC subunit A